MNNACLHQNIFLLLEDVFNSQKIKIDFDLYFDMNERKIIEVESISEAYKSIKIVKILETDTLTLESIRVIKKYKGQIFLPFRVDIIIGQYQTFEAIGLLKPEKCVAQLFYNELYELIDVDFVHPL